MSDDYDDDPETLDQRDVRQGVAAVAFNRGRDIGHREGQIFALVELRRHIKAAIELLENDENWKKAPPKAATDLALMNLWELQRLTASGCKGAAEQNIGLTIEAQAFCEVYGIKFEPNDGDEAEQRDPPAL